MMQHTEEVELNVFQSVLWIRPQKENTTKEALCVFVCSALQMKGCMTFMYQNLYHQARQCLLQLLVLLASSYMFKETLHQSCCVTTVFREGCVFFFFVFSSNPLLLFFGNHIAIHWWRL